MYKSLLSIGSDAKTSKGQALGILTAILYLTPADGYDGTRNLCPFASPGCKFGCLYKAGMGVCPSVEAARRERTRRFFEDRAAFISDLCMEMGKMIRRAGRAGLRPAARLNGTSDINWEGMPDTLPIIEGHKPVTFYDYTKSGPRMRRFLAGHSPDNYFLTFSRSEKNGDECRDVLSKGGNVAAVFSVARYPEVIKARKFGGFRILDGEQSDARFLDKRGGFVIALRAKGKALKDTTGFVIRDQQIL